MLKKKILLYILTVSLFGFLLFSCKKIVYGYDVLDDEREPYSLVQQREMYDYINGKALELGSDNYIMYYDSVRERHYVIFLDSNVSTVKSYALRVSNTVTNVYFLFFDENGSRIYPYSGGVQQYVYYLPEGEDDYTFVATTYGVSNNTVFKQISGNYIQTDGFYSTEQVKTFMYFMRSNGIDVYFTKQSEINKNISEIDVSLYYKFYELSWAYGGQIESPVERPGIGLVTILDPWQYVEPQEENIPWYRKALNALTDWYNQVVIAIENTTSISDIPTLLRTLFRLFFDGMRLIGQLLIEGLTNIGQGILSIPQNIVNAFNYFFTPSQNAIDRLNDIRYKIADRQVKIEQIWTSWQPDIYDSSVPSFQIKSLEYQNGQLIHSNKILFDFTTISSFIYDYASEYIIAFLLGVLAIGYIRTLRDLFGI